MTTNNKGLYFPAFNSYVGNWNQPVNTNWTGLDFALGGVTYIDAQGQSGTKTMIGTYSTSETPAGSNQYPPNGVGTSSVGETTSPSYIPFNIIITGTPIGNVVYRIPSGVCGQWCVYNNTSGSFTVGFQSGTGSVFTIEQGKRRSIVCDGTTISRADSPSDAQGTEGNLQFNNGNVFYGSAINYSPQTGSLTISPLLFYGTITGYSSGSGILTTYSSSAGTTQTSQPLVANMVIKNAAGTTIGTIASGSVSSWIITGITGNAASPTAYYAYPESSLASAALKVNSYDNQYGIQVVAGTVTGQSKGLLVRAGTNASDYSLLITSSATSPVTRFSINGYGNVVIEAPDTASTSLPTLKVLGKNTATPSSPAAVPPALDVRGGAYTLSYLAPFNSGAITIDCSISNVFYTTFISSVGSAPTFSNPSNGQTINWFISQDSTGGRTITWPTTFKWPNGLASSSVLLSTSGSKTDLLTATYLGGVWYATLINGYASTVPTS